MTNPAHPELRQAAEQARLLAKARATREWASDCGCDTGGVGVGQARAALQQHSPQQGHEQAGQMVSDERAASGQDEGNGNG